MENKNQKSLENNKNFPTEILIKKDFFVDILIDDKWHQGYIKEEKPNNKYDVIYLSLPNKISVKLNITKIGLSFYGDNYYQNNNNIREIILGNFVNELEANNIYEMLVNKLTDININLDVIENIISKIEDNQNYNTNIFENYENNFDKNNNKYIIENNDNKINITGFYAYQFFSGFFIDVIVFINDKLEKLRLISVKDKNNLKFDKDFEKLLITVLNITIFILVLGHNNLNTLKNCIQINRKNIIINKISSILASIETIISNLLVIDCYEYFDYPNIETKLKIICNLCYEIVLNSGNKENILPIQFLVNFINFITYEDNIIRIENFDKNKVYKIFLYTIQSINGDDLKYIKNYKTMKVCCKTIINKLYKKERKVLINNCYYTFLVNCLTKSNILEKKIMALHGINDIIEDLMENEKEINLIFKDFFINKNKIIDIFFEETVHDEILKISIDIFKYLSYYDSLDDKILNKLIEQNNRNNTIKNILCEIIKNLKNMNKKEKLFNNITKNFNFDDNDNTNNIIEFVTKLTLACFSSNENKNKNELDNEITNGKTSNDESMYNQNIINENINESRRISINIQILKNNGFFNNKSQKKNFTRNMSNNSLEKFLLNSSNYIKSNKRKSLKNTIPNLPKKNYFGLDLLFNYIIYNYDEKKALMKNKNIYKAIKSFNDILESTRTIKLMDIYYFLDRLLDNIASNKKNSSVVQSLKLIEIFLFKLINNNDTKNNNIYNINQNSHTFINFNEINEEEGEMISELDKKYDIISLITNDLIRYVSKVSEIIKNNDNYKNEIYEGIFPYSKNISIRLEILFFFVNFGLLINEKDHIIKIYTLFQSKNLEGEKNLFFREIASNIDFINNETLKKIISEIFQNNSLFDKSTFKDENAFNLIQELFVNINLNNESLIDDTKAIKVNKDLDKLEGIDFLFDILISNKNHIIQNKLCKLLSTYCLFLSNYRNNFCTKYWNNYINKITNLMNECYKNRNTIGILGLIQLIESIYSYNFSWKIPTKEETHVAQDPNVLLHFCCPQRENRVYKLKVGKVDKILHMRWKLAYFFDINVNDLVICDLNKKEYNFTYDDVNFYEIFPPKKYLVSENKIIPINVYEYPGQLLKIPNNPNELIEKNETIINILIDNLNNNLNKNNNNKSNENTENKIDDDFLMKKKIWNIMQKLPKKKYIENLIKQFEDNTNFEYDELFQKFSVNEIFILTFNLQCILSYLHAEQEIGNKKDKEKDKIKEINKFLDKFINFHHIDRTLYNNFMSINISINLNDTKYNFIYFECVNSLLELIQIIEEFKKRKTFSLNYTSISRDKETIQTKYDNTLDKENKDDLNSTKINNSFILKDTFLEVVGYKLLYNKLTDIMIVILNDNSSNESILSNLLQEIIKFINQIKNYYSDNNNSNNNIYKDFFEFIFENEALFKKIFIFDFIKCSKEEVKKLISNFLLKNLFDNYLMTKNKNKTKDKDKNNNHTTNDNNNNVKYIKNYFDIILTSEMFEYLVNNQKNGTYFNLISNIIEKYIIYNKKYNKNKNVLDIDDDTENDKYTENFKKIIDAIIKTLTNKNSPVYINNNKNNNYKESLLSYPYNNDTESISSSINSKNKKNENDSLINGILLFLLKILELSSIYENSIIDYFLEKIDVCEFLLLKGILNKNNENNLFSNDYAFNNPISHKIIFDIIIFLVKNIDNNKNIIKERKYLEDSLYMKIWKTMNKYHKLDFWKKSKNFELEYNDCNRKEFIGLKNMSSTCYMNSILQQFFMIPMLRETILGIENVTEQNTILYQLQLLFASLKTYDFKYYDPKTFVIVSKLKFDEQMDADEYYGLLIDKLENDISNLYNNDKDKNHYIDLFKYFFGIKLTDELYFIECKHKRFNESFCYNIQLEVKNYKNIKDSLSNYFKIEIMGGDNKINCEECNTKRVCHKQLKIKNLPNILVISLKRFDYDYRAMKKFKLNSYFEFPPELDMSEYLLDSNKNINEISTSESINNLNVNQNNLYELTGITIHYGVADYGHYYDIIKASNNKWYMFNDTNVKEFPENEIGKEAFGDRENDIDFDGENNDKSGIKQIDKKNAYILIYTKKKFKQNFTKNNEHKTKLIFPPYNKFSNINNNMKSYINYKMFKYWTMENLSNVYYQNFIIELIKLDLVKNIEKEIDKSHKNLIDILKNEDYLPIKNYINTGNTIFSFGLLYFCNIMVKNNKEKTNIQIYIDILTIYLENDINKCLFVLEEFSDIETIDIFFITNKNIDVIKMISDLISLAFNNYLNNCNDEHKNLNLFKFLNSIILCISNKYNVLCSNLDLLDNIVRLFCKLINKKPIFLKYLKNKGIEKWLDEIINKINNKSDVATVDINTSNEEDEQINMNILLTYDNFPKLECDHCILREKTNEFNFGIDFTKNKDIENLKKKNIEKKGKRNNSITSCDSIVLLRRLQDDIREIKPE